MPPIGTVCKVKSIQKAFLVLNLTFLLLVKVLCGQIVLMQKLIYYTTFVKNIHLCFSLSMPTNAYNEQPPSNSNLPELLYADEAFIDRQTTETTRIFNAWAGNVLNLAIRKFEPTAQNPFMPIYASAVYADIFARQQGQNSYKLFDGRHFGMLIQQHFGILPRPANMSGWTPLEEPATFPVTDRLFGTLDVLFTVTTCPDHDATPTYLFGLRRRPSMRNHDDSLLGLYATNCDTYQSLKQVTTDEPIVELDGTPYRVNPLQNHIGGMGILGVGDTLPFVLTTADQPSSS